MDHRAMPKQATRIAPSDTLTHDSDSRRVLETALIVAAAAMLCVTVAAHLDVHHLMAHGMNFRDALATAIQSSASTMLLMP